MEKFVIKAMIIVSSFILILIVLSPVIFFIIDSVGSSGSYIKSINEIHEELQRAPISQPTEQPKHKGVEFI